MCAERSQVFLKMSPTRHALYTIALLLLSFAAQRAASMSLERLGVDQNELSNSATKNDMDISNSESILVDDMELEAVPTNGNTDAYLLVPSGGLSERESVEKNMIENADGASNAAAEELHPNEATDMLMVETNEAPVQVSLLGVPTIEQETSAAEEEAQMNDQVAILTDTIVEAPSEPEKQEMVPVIAVEVEEPQGASEKAESAPLNAENNVKSELLLSGESESIGEVIAEAVLELKKDMQSAMLTDEAPINESAVESENAHNKEEGAEKVSAEKLEDTATQDEEREAIESLSAMEDNLMPEFEIMNLSEQVKSEENESDKTVEETDVIENSMRDEIKEQSAENEIPEETASKPIQSEEHIEFVPLEEQGIKVVQDGADMKSEVREKETGTQDATKLQNMNQQSEETHSEAEANTNAEAPKESEQSEQADGIKTNAEEEETKVGAMLEDMIKDVAADIAGINAEGNKEQIPAEDLKLVEEKKEEHKLNEDKQTDDESKAEDNIQAAEEQQTDTDTAPAEDDQLAEESEMAEEAVAVYEPLQVEENKLETEKLDEQQTAEEEIEENKVGNDPSQFDAMKQENAGIEETLPIGEVAEVSAPEEAAPESNLEQYAMEENTDAEITLPVYNEPADDLSEKKKQEALVGEELKPEENLLGIEESLIEETNKQKLETLTQAEINEGLPESQQIMEENFGEEEAAEAQQVAPHMEEQKVTASEELAEEQKEAEQEQLKEPQEQLAQQQAQLTEQQEQPTEQKGELTEHLEQLTEPEDELMQQQEQLTEQQETSEQMTEEAQKVEEQQQNQQVLAEVMPEEIEEQEKQQLIEQVEEQQQAIEKPQTPLVELQPMKEQEKLEEQNLQVSENLKEQQQLVQETAEEPNEQSQQTQVQPIELIQQPINTESMKPTNSLLTTIIQQATPTQQQANTPIENENVEPPSSLGDNNSPISVAISPPTSLAPLNVMDSVLNYVNGSFMQFNNNNNKQQENLQQKPPEDVDDLNAHLRRYDGAQVWRIVVQNDHQRKMADELQTKYGGQLWKEVNQEVDYLLKPQVLTEAAQYVRAANLSRIVLIENLQKVIETENPTQAEIASFQNRKGHRLTWKAYHRLIDIHGYFDYMAKTYPDICAVETIGYSLQKRPLKILKISNGNANNPGIWIDGGMHAREWISPATVTFIANQLVEGWDDLPDYMRNINWYIHAVANPDGYEYTHTTDRLWRKNMRSHGRQCPGVDLNRNFGYKWGGKGTSANPCSQTYRGSKAFSEPETFYISKFISNYPRDTFQAYLSFHSYGQYILYPWGYDYLQTADQMDLDRVARQAGTIITKTSGVKFTVGNSATTLYPAAGGSDDWAKGFAGIKYAYTLEMGDTGRYGFILPASHIETNGKDGYTFVETVARAITHDKRDSRKRAF